MNHTLSVKINKAVHDKIYLCNYITGQDWIPVDGSAQSGKTITFDHPGGDIVYIPASM
ncbi:MAG: hypothetical protein LUD68_06690 [Rikenellaceae bacterium]|nr:hypothetical protein [Rikenellaceae bacterium]